MLPVYVKKKKLISRKKGSSTVCVKTRRKIEKKKDEMKTLFIPGSFGFTVPRRWR